MKALLHICCGPCAIGPVQALRAEGWDVDGFFYNPNIHPYSEYKLRYQAVVEAGDRLGLSVLYHRYDFEVFLQRLAQAPDRAGQHRLCWRIRLEETARVAGQHRIEAFTTTLLASPHQDIRAIAALGEEIAAAQGLKFLERDFRKGFAEARRVSKEWQLYHQDYCGCLYSEKESVESREAKRAREAPDD